MGLRVWLPFNGNLKNNGLSADGVNKREISYSNGKIGQCIDFSANNGVASGSEHMVVIPGQQLSTFTLCTWIKVTTQATTDKQIAAREGTGYNANGWHIGVNANTNKIVVGASNASYTYSDTGEIDQWYHVAMIHENKKNYWYFNGEFKYSTGVGDISYNTTSTTDGNAIVFGARGSDGSYHWPFEGCLNDFRLYDEALSQKQIKEISKGLIAHYKLDGPKANENLILRSDKVTGGGQGSGITRTYMDDGTLKVVSTSGNGNYCSVNFAENSNTNVGAKMSVGDTYTISCDVKVEDGTTFPTLFINSGNNYKQLGGVTLKLNTWQRVYYTSTWNDPGTGYGNIALHLGFSGAIGTYYFKNFKLEKGNFTPWIPAPTDPMYTSLGYANDIYTDVSGNGYNATKNGILTFNSDSPRYGGSTSFSSSFISSPAGAVLAFSKDFTITGWFYHTSGTNYYASAESYNTSVCLENGRFFVYPSSGGAYVGNWSATNNVWQMLTLVHDSVAKTLTLFVNGVQTAQVTTDGTIYSNNTLNIGGRQNSAGYVGSISDFRIYATALSANDVKELYQTSAWIDNKQNIMTYEFKEV